MSSKILVILVITFSSTILDCHAADILKKKKDLHTKSLFLQTKFQRIELPAGDTLDASNGQHILSEQVNYYNPDNSFSEQANKKVSSGKINEVQHLNEVVVTTKSRFAPEHNGKVNVDFVLKVPKEMLSSKWRVTLMPKLLHNDSIVELGKIVLNGADFLSVKENDSIKYTNYVNSIIDKSKYDSAFLLKKAVSEQILKYQTNIYNRYKEDWKTHKDFLDKSNFYKQEQEKLDIEEKTFKEQKYAKYMQKINEEKMNRYLTNRDTTNVYYSFMDQYKKEVFKKKEELDKKRNKLIEKQLTYRTTDFSPQYTPNKNFRQQDSINIAKYNYDLKKIVENEAKEEKKEEVKKKLIKFKDEEYVRLDTLISSNSNFVYYYKQVYPVTPRLKKIRIYVDAMVEAIDQSSYHSPGVDTLSYFIASIAQLADTTLKYKVSDINRVAYNKVTMFLKYPQNKNSVLNINYEDNKDQMLNATMFIDAVKTNKVYKVDSVQIEVTRSLEGKYEDNANIAISQSNAVKNFLQNQYKDTDFANRFMAVSRGEDWNMLVKEIKSNDKIVNKDAILDLLANAKNPDNCKEEIKRKYKSDYAIIQNTIYPYMNKTDITFHVHRTDMTEDKEVRKEYKGKNYEEGLRLLQEREYREALKYLAEFGDYNTALCLVCLGYNGPAYELLGKLPKSAQTYYLKAIVANRLDRKDEAVQCLKESFKLDPTKRYRIGLDTEVHDLVTKNNID